MGECRLGARGMHGRYRWVASEAPVNLPWVSRVTYDQMKADHQRALDSQATVIENLQWEIEHQRQLTETLVTRLLPVLPVKAAPVERAPTEVSPITKAIRDEAAGDPRLAAFLRKRSRAIKAEHPDWEDSQIADELAKWETTETEATA